MQPAQKALNPKKSVPVTITHMVSPYCFYAQEVSENFASLVENMQIHYCQRDRVPLKNPEVGKVCVAKYSEDQAWYRARIKEINYIQRTIRVFFIDYGNEDVLPLSAQESLLCEIIDEFKEMRPMALKCSLQGIEPIQFSNVTSTEIVDFMFAEMGERVLARFMGASGDLSYVDIDFEQETPGGNTAKLVNLKSLLVEKKFAQFASIMNPKEFSDKLEKLSGIDQIMNQNKIMMDNVKYRHS